MAVLGVIGTINIVYGALCAMAQTDYKKLIAYSSVSHMGYVMLGMAALTTAGINGAVLQMFNHGTITAMLFILVGVIYDRAHHREINGFGGLASQMPVYAGVDRRLRFSPALGLPGLSAFISEVLVLIGAWQRYPMMTVLRRRHRNPDRRLYAVDLSSASISARSMKSTRTSADMTLREVFTLVPLAVIVHHPRLVSAGDTRSDQHLAGASEPGRADGAYAGVRSCAAVMATGCD